MYSTSYFKSASMLTASNKDYDTYNHTSRLHEVTAATSSYKTPLENITESLNETWEYDCYLEINYSNSSNQSEITNSVKLNIDCKNFGSFNLK